MPPVEEHDLLDVAVIWPAGGYGRDGQLKVSAVPQEIRCRWVEDVQSQGAASTAVIAQLYTDEDLDVGTVVWHGALLDLRGTSWEDQPEGLLQVENFHKVPDVDVLIFRRWADLVRFRDQLPTQE